MELLAQHSAFVDAVDRSGFIFVGTVKAIGSSTPTITRTRNSAVVRVDRVIEALPPIGDPTGKNVTVRLRDSQKLQKDQRAIFFTYLQTAGATLGLVEVMLQPETQATRVETQVKQARQILSDAALTRRLASARMVVVGVFGEPQPTEEARERKGEHDPMWWRGPIKVESFEKGERTEGPVSVNFASSDDVVWERSPKPKAGERAIFLLQPQVGRPIEKQYQIRGLFLIDPLDVQPVTELERVRKLIKVSAH
jgi:chloramphenicol 3-O-phosphotransferase